MLAHHQLIVAVIHHLPIKQVVRRLIELMMTVRKQHNKVVLLPKVQSRLVVLAQFQVAQRAVVLIKLVVPAIKIQQ